MARTLTTASTPRRERVGFWNKAVSETFVSLGVSAKSGRESIDGEIDVRPLADLQVSTVRASPQVVSRSLADVESSPGDGWYLVGIQTRGSCVVTQDGRAAHISHGGFAVYDTQRPYSLDLATSFEQIVVQIPRTVFERNVVDAESLTASGVDPRLGASTVLLSAVTSLSQNIESLSSDAASSLARGIEHLVFAGLAPIRDRGRHESRRALIQRYLLANLRDPELSVQSVAQALHLSPSTVHRAFSFQGETLMTWVWSRRLDGIYRELVSGITIGTTLTKLAQDWGFSNSAHFSRAFRTKFGTSPSAIRDELRDSTPLALSPRESPTGLVSGGAPSSRA